MSSIASSSLDGLNVRSMARDTLRSEPPPPPPAPLGLLGGFLAGSFISGNVAAFAAEARRAASLKKGGGAAVAPVAAPVAAAAPLQVDGAAQAAAAGSLGNGSMSLSRARSGPPPVRASGSSRSVEAVCAAFASARANRMDSDGTSKLANPPAAVGVLAWGSRRSSSVQGCAECAA